MISRNPLAYSGQIIAQILGKILYFPVWWYSVGFVRFVKGAGKFFSNQEKSLGLLVWVKNLFIPMYGQRDWAGRLISFLVRSVQIIARSLIMAVWFILVIFALLSWLAIPLLLIIALGFQLA